MALFDDWAEYEKMGQSKPKPHIANLERERAEREREQAARMRCIHPGCSSQPEAGKPTAARPWSGSGLCREHYQKYLGDDVPDVIAERQARERNRRAVANEREIRGLNRV